MGKRAGFGGMDMGSILASGWVRGEDYLTVTVTTPDASAGGLPVLVFLHGGGFTAGAAQAAMYDGTSFARDGVVLVTLNYRLGVSGWLDVPGAPANRGLLDVIAALRWVAANIATFGGDPGKVTVAGQSAGAMIVGALLATPAADGLFQRAISQSGNGECAYVPEQAAVVTRAVAGELGVAAMAEALGEVEDSRLVDVLAQLPPAALAELRDGTFRDTSLGANPFKPVLDGVTLERQPALAVRSGPGSGAELLIGTNTGEANLYTVPSGTITAMGEVGLRAAAARRYEDPEKHIDGYRARFPDASPGELATRLTTDAFVEGSRHLADAHAARPGTRTFAYEFTWGSDAFDGGLGACHCVELPFVFDRTRLAELHGPRSLLGERASAADLAARMHSAWTAFVTTGDPGWKQYGRDGCATMVIDTDWHLESR
jgi:para-nitrobenzyl esterase